MTPLRLIKPKDRKLSLEELLLVLHPDHLDKIEGRARKMREEFPCPFVVRDYREFRDTLYDFWAHMMKTYYNFDYKGAGLQMDGITKDQCYQFVEQHLGGYKALLLAERNAIAGREGGMIKIIDEITEALIKRDLEIHWRSVFFEFIELGDYELRDRLAQELLNKYGPTLLPGESLIPWHHLASNLEEFIKEFVTHIHGVRRRLRR